MTRFFLSLTCVAIILAAEPCLAQDLATPDESTAPKFFPFYVVKKEIDLVRDDGTVVHEITKTQISSIVPIPPKRPNVMKVSPRFIEKLRQRDGLLPQSKDNEPYDEFKDQPLPENTKSSSDVSEIESLLPMPDDETMARTEILELLELEPASGPEEEIIPKESNPPLSAYAMSLGTNEKYQEEVTDTELVNEPPPLTNQDISENTTQDENTTAQNKPEQNIPVEFVEIQDVLNLEEISHDEKPVDDPTLDDLSHTPSREMVTIVTKNENILEDIDLPDVSELETAPIPAPAVTPDPVSKEVITRNSAIPVPPPLPQIKLSQIKKDLIAETSDIYSDDVLAMKLSSMDRQEILNAIDTNTIEPSAGTEDLYEISASAPQDATVISFTLEPGQVVLDDNIRGFLQDHVLGLFQSHENFRLEINAYSSSLPQEEYSHVRISLARALEVRRYLIDHGVAPSRMKLKSMAKNDPVDDDRIDLVLVE